MPATKETGFLLIADMENSTGSKFVLGEDAAFDAIIRHNRLVIDTCTRSVAEHGIVLNSLGDSVVVKFPLHGHESDALQSCLQAARLIID